MTTLSYSAFEKALAQLETSLRYLHSEASGHDPELRKQFRAASIQAFEYTYELGTKMILRQLEQIVPAPSGLRELNFRDLIRTAADAGLVREAPPFWLYREKRNITSHAYNEAKAEEVLTVIEPFARDMHFVLEQLKKRNP